MQQNDDDENYAFNERVAIMIYDGGLTEQQAIVEAIKFFREIEHNGE